MPEPTDLDAPQEPDDAGVDHEVDPALVELHELHEWQEAVEAEAEQVGK